ncbi:shootin-1 isoform X2 [Oncorhynchus tshawytscha]|uniref:shootin-1 isoform X2 n=1 Tax=Oncorhynchus tshawytscha TaxID=74940 RepID=UPI001C3C947C|nr:shootin-1 isoform X2 [Oncorhynchus tshawytscha]
MWTQGEDTNAAASGGESSCSSEDEGDIQCEILEKQRDEANQKLSEMEEVSSQLLKEMEVLEMQFQIERSCRESAEALAVKVTKDNKVLKRKSQALLPFIPELPENLEADLGVDPDPDGDSGEDAVLQGQAQIRELQASVDQLLGEKLRLCEQVEALRAEQNQLKEQLALEIDEREAILKKVSKQNKTMNKMKRVSQLVTEEFTEISQKLELEEGLRQHAEVFAHQVLVKQKQTQRQSMVLQQSSETSMQLQQALEQVAHINSTLQDIQLYYRNQVKQTQCALEESSVLSELQIVRGQLESSEKERRAMETHLREAQITAAHLQGEEPDPSVDMKTRAVDEMMERIKKGIVLRPTLRPQPGSEDDSAWRDHRSEKRKSAVLDLKGMLDTMNRPGHRRAGSRKRISRNVGEAELHLVLLRRRRAMGDGQDTPGPSPTPSPAPPTTKIQGPQPGGPAAGALLCAGERGSTPVLRRLQQNREKRNSRIRSSELIICQEEI